MSERPQRRWNPEMGKYLGKTMTVTASGRNSRREIYYRVFEDRTSEGIWWHWYEDTISGLAEPEREYTVELRFDGMITTATLKRGGRDVKTAEARCNPKDTYSRAEGARVAVERLFEKKRKEDKPKESKREQGKPKVGDKFVVVQKRYSPYYRCAIWDIVTLEAIGPMDNLYRLVDRFQYVDTRELKPYKENAK